MTGRSPSPRRAGTNLRLRGAWLRLVWRLALGFGLGFAVPWVAMTITREPQHDAVVAGLCIGALGVVLALVMHVQNERDLRG